MSDARNTEGGADRLRQGFGESRRSGSREGGSPRPTAMRYRTSVSSSICIDPRSAFEIGQPASACLATAANSLLSIP